MRSVAVALPLIALLAACGGGGSSPTRPVPPEPPPAPVMIEGEWSDVVCTFVGFKGEGCVAQAYRRGVGATQSFTAQVEQDDEDIAIFLTDNEGNDYRPFVGTVNANGRVKTTVEVVSEDTFDVVCGAALFTIMPKSYTANGDATTETIDLNYFEDGDLLRGGEFYSTYRARKEFHFQR